MKTRVIQRCGWLAAATLGLGVISMGCSGDEGGEPQGRLGPLPGNIAQEVVERTDPPAQTVNLTNAGNCPLAFTIATQTSDGAAWLSVGSGIGTTVQPGASKTLSVEFHVKGPPPLLPGTYTGTITITGTCETTGRPAAGSPAVIAVNLTVTPLSASIAVDQSEVTQDVVDLQNQWSAIRAGPHSLRSHTAVWTGYEMMVWGGLDGQGNTVDLGAAYDPVTDTWARTAMESAPSKRWGHTAVWTGAKMIVWGGQPDFVSANDLATGALYDPVTREWTATADSGAPPGRAFHTAVWTGTRMLVWGGSGAGGWAYDPSGAGAWTQISSVSAPSSTRDHTALWTGRRMIVWGGRTGSADSTAVGSGGSYDPVSDSWEPISDQDAPSPRTLHGAVWTGRWMIVWGGKDSSGAPVGTGGLYDPVTDTWSPMVDFSANQYYPPSRWSHRAVWTGGRMIVFGGTDASGRREDGGRYDPSTRTWSSLSTSSGPGQREGFTASWTGNAMIVWGGRTSEPATSTGSLYR